MNERSAYYHLRYVVECQPADQGGFVPIAAFITNRPAIVYAIVCLKAAKKRKDNCKYRVMYRNRHDALTIHATHEEMYVAV